MVVVLHGESQRLLDCCKDQIRLVNGDSPLSSLWPSGEGGSETSSSFKHVMLCINTSFISIIPSTNLPSSTPRRSTFNFSSKSKHPITCSIGGTVAEPKATAAAEPLLLNVVRGIDVERPPVWLMKQAGRYMKVDNKAAVLGFVGAPFTLASYVVEGGSSKHFSKIKRLAFSESKVLHSLLQKFSSSMARYIQYQADNGAQAVQIVDSWATELSPVDFEEFSLPYLKQIVDIVKKTHPELPLILYAGGSGGLLDRLALTGVDVVSLDWTVDMADGRKRLGPNIAVQGNADPGVLFGSKEFITDRINDTVRKAGRGKHILNLGHGIVVGTPEENVAHFFEVAKGIRY